MSDVSIAAARKKTKVECLAIEEAARAAVARLFGCVAGSERRVTFPGGKTSHRFDIYVETKVIGGISTLRFNNSTGSPNISGRDRMCAELLWLSLWPGVEQRVLVATDALMAQWLIRRFEGISFPQQIGIYHYHETNAALEKHGSLRAG